MYWYAICLIGCIGTPKSYRGVLVRHLFDKCIGMPNNYDGVSMHKSVIFILKNTRILFPSANILYLPLILAHLVCVGRKVCKYDHMWDAAESREAAVFSDRNVTIL